VKLSDHDNGVCSIVIIVALKLDDVRSQRGRSEEAKYKVRSDTDGNE